MQNEDRPWHALEVDEVRTHVETDLESGLTTESVTSRQDEFGKNVLPEKEKTPEIIKFLRQFNDVLVYVLLAAAVVTGFLGEYIDTIVIVLVVTIIGVVGYLQENKAEEALEGIKKLLETKATIVRNGKQSEIDSSDLVVGDVLVLAAGDKVPADARVVQAEKFKVEESALTGEATTVEKKSDVVKEDAVLADRKNMVYSGTSVATGSAKAIVTAIGEGTELGQINASISEVQTVKTPLIRQTTKFGQTVSIAILIISVVIYAFGYFLRDYEPVELMLTTIGLAVAAIPEGLPAVISIILALGVRNMAEQKAIVRSLPSVETLGAVSVICTDKTGTLTKNEMTVKQIVTANHDIEVSGSGYAPNGDLELNGQPFDLDDDESMIDLLTVGKTCNDSQLNEEDGDWVINGDPTEACLLTVAEKAERPIERLKVISKIPFDSEYKYMATLVDYKGERMIFVKGAPDRLFDMASSEDFKQDYWDEKRKEIADRGQRVLGAGLKRVDSSKASIDHEDVEDGLTFLGLFGIVDPPRQEAIDAVAACRDAGIRIKMITGDHKDTAVAIAKELGMEVEGALEGRELTDMTDEEIKEASVHNDVFARTSPNDKLRLVKGLQENGLITSMTGDGVNDAPALKRADIGVAMGIKGTEVAKEASQMVLVDDNFKTIYNAVREGRRVYDNLKKTILFLLPTNGGQALLVAMSILLGAAAPLSPVQILWVNMVVAITLSLAIAFEPLEESTMKRPPRPANVPLLSRYYIFRVTFVSIIIGGGSLWINYMLGDFDYSTEKLQTITLNAIVMAQLFHLYNCRTELAPAFNRHFFDNKIAFLVSALLIALQLFITYVPFMHTLFGTAPLTWEDWIYPVAFGAVVFIIVEIEKAISRRVIGNRNIH
ncbi:cation-transporting P-type ATPase [Exiguobacterium profundum]|uniref:cation-transporting P-type ATPase n=1 Tax=Exiguobacterium TaxID=33986 RepID=UPI0018C3611D|nr:MULTISPECIES: cation-transporting P-type ATPase [Exiguobacterium]QPI66426.1 cation-transporting P-type ATPase [Exiguobacterium sp. PBE]MBG0916958.1 cation-transporting P-type ATPase [Exiguobacterium sp. SRB7LM]MCT4799027.1 cation-transporting P-type ATPase [Exiguobacterium profundum]MCV9899198.1 cation-transporting P-type ATPase [Exiguobacterium sp. N5]MDT0191502.1 cation-transporting P-type ATPase [Exiguobacterium sp. BG5(2022)]